MDWLGSLLRHGVLRHRRRRRSLSGAALTSFTKKCEKDAEAGCDASAKVKKLAGAAKSSFTKKCVSDAVGA